MSRTLSQNNLRSGTFICTWPLRDHVLATSDPEGKDDKTEPGVRRLLYKYGCFPDTNRASSARLAIEPLIQYTCSAETPPLQDATLRRIGMGKHLLDEAAMESFSWKSARHPGGKDDSSISVPPGFARKEISGGGRVVVARGCVSALWRCETITTKTWIKGSQSWTMCHC